MAVGKLRFKGEPEKRKKKPKTAQKPTQEQDDPETWVVAESGRHLKGPIVVSHELVCLCADQDGVVYTESFTGQASDVRQVFVLSAGVIKEGRVMKSNSKTHVESFALKSSSGKYVSVGGAGASQKLGARAIAVGPSETFGFDLQGSAWVISAGTGYLHLNADGTASIGEQPMPLEVKVQAKQVLQQRLADRGEVMNIGVKRSDLESKVGRALTDVEYEGLKEAREKGRLNEALLDIREKTITDSRC